MASMKITITLPEKQLKAIRRSVKTKEAASVSGFVQDAIQRSLDNKEILAFFEGDLMETGGPLTAKERAEARKWMTPPKRRTKAAKPRKAA
jgi:Arc/MetJ-type ribon-helix-helix transcriptional regulator